MYDLIIDGSPEQNESKYRVTYEKQLFYVREVRGFSFLVQSSVLRVTSSVAFHDVECVVVHPERRIDFNV